MPHSSGGGSHGGGSHGGSHSGSGGSSSSNRSHSSTYFEGARHYVYYKNKKPVHFYSDKKITVGDIKKRKKIWAIVQILLALVYLLIFVGIFFTTVYVRPHKLSKECIDNNLIVDTNDLILASEEAEIMKQIDEFREKTGISVTIYTTYNDTWMPYYDSLENYAYDLYVQNLEDEKNWLIVYSEPETYDTFNDWYWEGMQGDDTDRILTSKSTKFFNKEMQKNISKDGFPKAVVETFDSYNDVVLNTYFDALALVFSLLFLAVHGGIFYFIFWLLLGSNIKIDEKAIELANPQYTYIEDSCKYCGGLYIHGIHTSCPHCGGALDPLDRPIIINGNQTDGMM